jgi:hypothetical protein
MIVRGLTKIEFGDDELVKRAGVIIVSSSHARARVVGSQSESREPLRTIVGNLDAGDLF